MARFGFVFILAHMDRATDDMDGTMIRISFSVFYLSRISYHFLIFCEMHPR